jgi:hypothetical protein
VEHPVRPPAHGCRVLPSGRWRRDTFSHARGLCQLVASVDGLGYGLGVAVGAAQGGTFLFKRGNNLGYRSGLIAFPHAAKAAVVMTNADNGEELVDDVLFALRDMQGWPRFDRLPE